MTGVFVISGFGKGGGKNAYLSIIDGFKRKKCNIIILSFGPKSGVFYPKFKKLTNEIKNLLKIILKKLFELYLILKLWLKIFSCLIFLRFKTSVKR